ncbi:hypothetical protein PINS_up001814 [Pythium insidiosum]|nr:hypothetical protein PINS_up001814 [Pythium insidiosum]
MVVPKLPGWGSAHRLLLGRTDFRKPQLLQQLANGHVPAPDATPQTHDKPWTTIVSSSSSSSSSRCPTSSPKSSSKTRVESSKFRVDPSQPAWIAYERVVLRFFAYFEDGGRVRRVVLLLHLSDRSLAISEPRVANSGLAQGAFLRRSTAVRKPNGDRFAPEDFSVGGCVALLGRTFHVVDCDAATREFYAEALAAPQSSPRRYPDDAASSPAAELDALRERLLAARHAQSRRETESDAERVRKFHAHSQQVLRFFVSWRDPHPLYPETRRYVLHFYLSDDTLEVVEPKHEREGRGHFAVLLSRRKMPKMKTANTTSTTSETTRWLEPRDLRCGDVVELASRRFLLEDCDAFTRDYYLETHGVTQERSTAEEQAEKEKQQSQRAGKRQQQQRKWQQLFEPHDRAPVTSGVVGSSSNSSSSSPEPPQEMAMTQSREALAGKQLRFRARFHAPPTPTGDDGSVGAAREFVLTYFLEDDTLAVFEPRVRNSGVAGGRFLDRGRFRRPPSLPPTANATDKGREGTQQQRFYRASDFFVGAVVAFAFAPHQRLELLEADRQTLALCESLPEQFPFSDARAVLRVVSTLVAQHRQRHATLDVRRECRAMDATRDGALSPEQLTRLLPRLGVAPAALNAQQMITLCRRFELNDADVHGADSAPRFGYDDFCDAIAALVLSQSAPSSQEPPPLLLLLARLRRCVALRRVLREMAPTSRAVAIEDVATACAAFHVQLRESDRQEIVRRFGSRESRQCVDRERLCDGVFELPPLRASAPTPPPRATTVSKRMKTTTTTTTATAEHATMRRLRPSQATTATASTASSRSTRTP